MKTFLLACALTLAAAPALANDFVLDGMSIQSKGKTDYGEAVEVSGKCGSASVRITGANRDESGVSVGSEAVLTVKGAKGTLATGQSDTFFLESANELACVATPKGPMLLLAAFCTARECPEVNYQVIDTASMRQLTFYDWDKPCTRACAEKALGMKVPAALQSL